MTVPRSGRTCAALRSLACLPLLAAIGCSRHEPPPAVEPGSPAFAAAAAHPASGPLPAFDVTAWRRPNGLAQDHYYAAVGSAGIMVHLADGAFLQRLGHSAASHVDVLYDVPVDAVAADFLVAVDPSDSRLTWFAIDAGSGALRRLAGQPAEVGAAVGGLCTRSDAGANRHRVLVVTRAGELQDWSVVAQAGKQPNFANRIVATRERTLALGGTGGDCAVDPDGNVFVIVDGHELRRVSADWTPAAAPVMRSGEPRSLEGAIAAVDLVTDDEGEPVLVIADQDGRRLLASDTTGRRLASTRLEHEVSALKIGGDTVAIVADGGTLRLAPWQPLSAMLAIRGGRHEPPAARP